jgi:hypothetical protein
MNEKELKAQIFKKFEQSFSEIGITSSEEIQFRTELPEQQELSKNSEVLSEIGRWGDRVVFSIKKFIRGAWKVLAVIVVLITAIEKAVTYTPHVFRVAGIVESEIQQRYNDYKIALENENPDKNGYIVVSRYWQHNPSQFIIDLKKIGNEGSKGLQDIQGMDIFPVSGVTGETGMGLSATNDFDINRIDIG